jgi:hypothetical protein
MPFRPKGTNALMAIALLTNSDERWWTDQDLQRMMSIIETLIANSGKHVKNSGTSTDQEEVTAKLQMAQAYTDQVRLEFAQLKAKYDSLATQAATAASQAESMALMADNQRLLEDTVKQLEVRNRELESLLGK